MLQQWQTYVSTANSVSQIRITYSEHPGARSWSQEPHNGKGTSLTKGRTKEPFEVFTTADRVTPSSPMFSLVNRARG